MRGENGTNGTRCNAQTLTLTLQGGEQDKYRHNVRVGERLLMGAAANGVQKYANNIPSRRQVGTWCE